VIHLVTFTLNPFEVDRAKRVINELMDSAAWMHEVTDTWLIDTAENKYQIWNRLSKYMLPQDRILIVEVTRQNVPWGYLSQDGWNWVNLHLAMNDPPQQPPPGYPNLPLVPQV
jgi:hypothetical protein